MGTANTAGYTVQAGGHDSVFRQLHERIDNAAKEGEKLENTLHERGARVHEMAQQVGTGAQGRARELEQRHQPFCT